MGEGRQRAGSCRQQRKEREGVFHRNHEPDLAQGQGHAGIAAVPLHLEWKESAPILPPEFSIITCLTLGRKFMLIPKLLHQRKTRARGRPAPRWGSLISLCATQQLHHYTGKHGSVPPAHTHTHAGALTLHLDVITLGMRLPSVIPSTSELIELTIALDGDEAINRL